MIAKATTTKPDGMIETVVSWFRSTDAGRHALQTARTAEEEQRHRPVARAAYVAALARRPEIQKLADRLADAEAEMWAALDAAGLKVCDARRAFEDLNNRTDREKTTAERALRRTADVRIRDNGTVDRALLAAREHLRLHGLGVGGIDRIVLADCHREGRNPAELTDVKRRVALADSALASDATIDAARARLADLQLEVGVDVDAALAALAKSLPERCPCGAPFDFSALRQPAPGLDPFNAIPLTTIGGVA